jgi:Carboxypeptidase regulatory-like domain
MHARVCAALVLIAVIAAPSSAAQSAGSELQGTIVSGSGAPIAGVTVTITNLATRAASEAVTGADGRFTIAGLSPGAYEVQASHHGYATRRQSPVPLEAGQALTVRMELTAAPDP